MPTTKTDAYYEIVIPDLNPFYRLGQQAIKTAEGQPSHARRVALDALAEAHGVSTGTVLAARRVAKVISSPELDELLAMARESFFIIRRGHLRVLSSISDPRQRSRWARTLVANEWTISRLQREIHDALGKRCNGGRQARAPSSLKEARWLMDSIENRWQVAATTFETALDPKTACALFCGTLRLDSSALPHIEAVTAGLSSLRDNIEQKGRDVVCAT